MAARESAARQARFRAGHPDGDAAPAAAYADDKENRHALTATGKAAAALAAGEIGVRRDFFGRVIEAVPLGERDANAPPARRGAERKEARVWVTFHEGLNNAVRKPISLQEFLRGF